MKLRWRELVRKCLVAACAALPPSALGDDPLPAPSVDVAWAQIRTAFESKGADKRIQAVTALSVLGGNADATVMLRKAFGDADIDVRLAAIVAAGETKDRNFTTALRSMLDDDNPQIAFVAALTLSKMGDRSGEDILADVVVGSRKTDRGFLKSGMHHMNRSLHRPKKLAKEGAMQTASIFLPPLGYGMGAYQYMRGGARDPRVQALNELTKEHNDAIRDGLIDASDDKDEALRVEAAEELAKYRGKEVTDALGKMFADGRQRVRLMACAAYISASAPVKPAAKRTVKK